MPNRAVLRVSCFELESSSTSQSRKPGRPSSTQQLVRSYFQKNSVYKLGNRGRTDSVRVVGQTCRLSKVLATKRAAKIIINAIKVANRTAYPMFFNNDSISRAFLLFYFDNQSL